jgi:predicted hydrocarbon binding protein
MLWDPIGFPKMIYDVNKEDGTFAVSDKVRPFAPWKIRLFLKIFLPLRAVGLMPRSFAKVKDMKKFGAPWEEAAGWERSGKIEYLEDISREDEHHFRITGSSDCWGLENVGVPLAWHLPPHMAGQVNGFEEVKDWNAIETKCIGLGNPHCEVELVPTDISELRPSLEMESTVVERVHNQLMDRALGFLLEGQPLVERPGFGNMVHLHPVIHGLGFPYLTVVGGRYRMSLRMGGARAGKKIGERLIEEGVKGNEAIKRVMDLMEHCKVGRIEMGDTVRMWENCECYATDLMMEGEEPSCYFTTGFLNGLFSSVRDEHLKETHCMVTGDPYCEWEIT